MIASLERFLYKHAVSILICLTLLIYFNSLFNGFIGDDFDQIVRNGLVHSVFNIPRFFLGGTFFNGYSDQAGIYYKPILSTLFSLIYPLSFGSAFTFRLVQVLLHITNGLLIYKFLQKIFASKKIPFFISLLFLISPVNAESVLYISALQDVGFFTFGMVALLSGSEKKLTRKNYVLMGVFLMLSLLTKETGILFLPAIFLYRFLFTSKENLRKILFPESLVFLIYIGMRFFTTGIYKTVGETYPFFSLNLNQRLINTPEIFFRYLGLFAFPRDLAFTQNWVIKTISVEGFYLPLAADLLFLLLLVMVGVLIKRKSKTNFKIYLFFALWFLEGMALHLQIIPLDMTFAERWAYFPYLGLLGMVGVLVKSLEFKVKSFLYLSLITCLLLLISAYSVRTFVRTFDWRDQYTLYSHDVLVEPDSFNLQNGLAQELMNKGDYKDAKAHILESIALKSDYCYSWNNLGLVYLNEKNYPKAKSSFQTAIKNGGCYLAYENLGTFLYFHADSKEAQAFLNDAVTVLPSDARLYFMLSLTDAKLGDKQEAVDAITKSNELAPSNGTAYIYQMILNNQPINLKEN